MNPGEITYKSVQSKIDQNQVHTKKPHENWLIMEHMAADFG